MELHHTWGVKGKNYIIFHIKIAIDNSINLNIMRGMQELILTKETADSYLLSSHSL